MTYKYLKVWDSLNFILCFILARWIFKNYLFSYSIEIFHFRQGELWEILIVGGLVLVLTNFFFVLLRFLYLRKINMTHLLILYGIYFLLLVYSLFFKNIGLQGYELNPMTYFDGLAYGYWFEPVINLLLFIPLGFLLSLNWKSFLGILMIFLSVEILQYVFHLGIFDVGDFLANMSSLLLGQTLRVILLRFGFREWLV